VTVPPPPPPQALPLASDLADLAGATERLLATLGGIDDDAARRPSLLPGWTVGHVVTHLARNADGILRLVDWARTGRRTPMYPGPDARAEDIEHGSGRSAADLLADVRSSATRLGVALDLLASSGDEALDRLVIFGAATPDQVPDSPARSLPFARLREVEIHHVDLDLGYRPSDWPADFVERTLLFVHSRSGAIDVVGEPADVLAWRIGRGRGAGVHRLDGTDPGAPPPGW
jgi:maleylpyruvate isomerase